MTLNTHLDLIGREGKGELSVSETILLEEGDVVLVGPALGGGYQTAIGPDRDM